MKNLLLIVLFVSAGIFSNSLLAQNTYVKSEVMEQITNLHPNLQTFINDHWNRLNNAEVAGFMKISFEKTVKDNYSKQMEDLKLVATEEEMENLYKSLTEEALQTLLDKYGISY